MSETVIITGGTEGLGLALVTKWLAEGWNVATCARSEHKIELLRGQFKGKPLVAEVLSVVDREAVTAFVTRVSQRFGTVDVLINNASILGPRVEVLAYPEDVWSEVLAVNLDGIVNFSRAVAPGMVERRSGVIVNISSGAGIVGKPKWGAYAVSKFAVEGFTQVLRSELFEHRVRVHAFDPGKMRTKMRAAAYPEEDASTLPSPELVASIVFDIAAVYEPQLGRLDVKDYL